MADEQARQTKSAGPVDVKAVRKRCELWQKAGVHSNLKRTISIDLISNDIPTLLARVEELEALLKIERARPYDGKKW